MEEFKFPSGFLWGSATASYQIEGGIENNDWALEARSGKIPAAGLATNHRQRWEEDLDWLVKLNQNAYGFSIEWSLIEPEEGQFDLSALDFYRKILDGLEKRGIKPMVTIWHFTLPEWFYRLGGFENKKAPFYFTRYAEFLWEQLGDRVGYWLSINEPNVFTGYGYLKGIWPPFKKNFWALKKVLKTLISSHLILCDIKRKKFNHLRLGFAHGMFCFEWFNPMVKYLWNSYFLNRVSSSLDFIGLNYYHPWRLWKHLLPPEKVTDVGWEIYPEGIYLVLKDLKRYQKPIYITENGLADAIDSRREKFIRDHLHWVWRAIQEKVDIRGYFHWSLLDNFEWVRGFNPSFGLLEVDYQTFERKPRPSAWKYAEICKENKLKIDLN